MPKTLVKKSKGVEERIVERVKYCVENNIKLEVPNLSPEEIIKQCQQKLTDLLFYHYYLIFIQEMIDGGVLLAFKMKYNVKTNTLKIRSIGETIRRLPLLDPDDVAFHVELMSVAEQSQEISMNIHQEIERTNKFSKWIDSMVFARAKFLPSREYDPEQTNDQVYAEVIRITAINYLANNVFSIGFPKQPMEQTLDLPKDFK